MRYFLPLLLLALTPYFSFADKLTREERARTFDKLEKEALTFCQGDTVDIDEIKAFLIELLELVRNDMFQGEEERYIEIIQCLYDRGLLFNPLFSPEKELSFLRDWHFYTYQLAKIVLYLDLKEIAPPPISLRELKDLVFFKKNTDLKGNVDALCICQTYFMTILDQMNGEEDITAAKELLSLFESTETLTADCYYLFIQTFKEKNLNPGSVWAKINLSKLFHSKQISTKIRIELSDILRTWI